MASIILDAKTGQELVKTLRELKAEVARLREKLDEEQEPRYGSKKWWEWSNQKAQQDIKDGRYNVISNKKELQQFLDSLKGA